eukprot:scaffold355295_cov17-Prasinocladus_malaysianus.AAC.1
MEVIRRCQPLNMPPTALDAYWPGDSRSRCSLFPGLRIYGAALLRWSHNSHYSSHASDNGLFPTSTPRAS